MKIIFESEEEKEKFIESMSNAEICPTSMFLEEIEGCMGDRSCLKCWRYATNRSNVSIEDDNLVERIADFVINTLHTCPIPENDFKCNYGYKKEGCRECFIKYIESLN